MFQEIHTPFPGRHAIMSKSWPSYHLNIILTWQLRYSYRDHVSVVQVGDVAVGSVQSVQLYGAFLELEDGTSGLLHISQISHDRVQNVADVLSIGDKIKVTPVIR